MTGNFNKEELAPELQEALDKIMWREFEKQVMPLANKMWQNTKNNNIDNGFEQTSSPIQNAVQQAVPEAQSWFDKQEKTPMFLWHYMNAKRMPGLIDAEPEVPVQPAQTIEQPMLDGFSEVPHQEQSLPQRSRMQGGLAQPLSQPASGQTIGQQNAQNLPIQNQQPAYPEQMQSVNMSNPVQDNQGMPTGFAAKVDNNVKNKYNPVVGMYNDYKGFKDPISSIAYALGAFYTNYNEMKDANTINADKYFHARANYDAAQQGLVGYTTAKLISDLREITDFYRNIYEKHYTKEFSKKDIEEDQHANAKGRELGYKNPTLPANTILQHLMPNGLPQRYKQK